MCELLAVRSEGVRSFAGIRDWASAVEAWGIAGFGWGVAWLAHGPDGMEEVRVVRGLGRFADEAGACAELEGARSTHFLVHLRRPSRLSTIAPSDTQPFGGGDHAWCHNGYLDRAEDVRPSLAGRLRGRADSEVGWQWWLDRRAAGVGVADGLRAVDAEFGGHVNLGYLGADGVLAVYGRNPNNQVWRFRSGTDALACTGLHSRDDSLFERVFPDGEDRRCVGPGEVAFLDDGAAGRRPEQRTRPGVRATVTGDSDVTNDSDDDKEATWPSAV